MAFARLFLLAALIAVAYAQYLDVDSFSIDAPSEIYGGEVHDIEFDVTFTPTMGAASLIEGSDASNRFMVAITLSTDGDSLTLDGAGTVDLTNAQQTVDMTDDDSVTWNDLEAQLNLTDVDCGNGTTYQYVCVNILPPTGVSWGAVDTSNSSLCISYVCKAVADVTVSAFEITNPDDNVITVGGGQSITFTTSVQTASSSDDVVGSNNWEVTLYLSDAETGGDSTADESATLTTAQKTIDLSGGSTAAIGSLTVTLDLEDVTCDDFAYACVEVEPSSSAYWTRPASPSDNYMCISVTCGACAVKTSVAVMLAAVLLSFFFNH